MDRIGTKSSEQKARLEKRGNNYLLKNDSKDMLVWWPKKAWVEEVELETD